MSLSSVITTQQQDEFSSHKCGGKAANLHRLQQLGQAVPRFYVLPSDIMGQVTEAFEPAESGRSDELTASVLQQQVLNVEIPSNVVDALEVAHGSAFPQTLSLQFDPRP